MKKALFQRTTAILGLMSLAFTTALAQSNDEAITKIKDEGMNRSQVMQTLSYLSDVIGPRLTASPNMKRANEWTREKLTEWGLQNGHLEAWGPFGRGWSLEKFSAQVVSPQNIPLIAFPKAWSPGVKGTVTGEVIYLDAKNNADLEKYKGKLRGAIVFLQPIREVPAHFTSQGARFSDEELDKIAKAETRTRVGTPGARPPVSAEMRAQQAFAGSKLNFCLDEGAAIVAEPARGDGGTLFVQQATVPQPPPIPATPPTNGTLPVAPSRRLSAYDVKAPKITPQIVIASEHYNRVMRMLAAGERVRASIELGVKFYNSDLMAYNTIAEIPGTDLKDQLVMLGGHMDSWHSGTGATDNGAGVAVCMEAVRILKTLNLQPRRTIRIGLWSGEEEGLLGSRAYVAKHFGTRKPGVDGGMPVLEKGPEYDKLSGYFNLDNGTGKVRGVYQQGNTAIAPIFKEWLAPFKEMGASTLTISNTGGTDHLSYDGIGLPGFQFIQDEIEYDTRTHHSNQDVFDRIQAEDLKQASVIMASFIYNASMRDEMLPKKEVGK